MFSQKSIVNDKDLDSDESIIASNETSILPD